MQYTTWLERWIPANLPWTVFTGKLEIVKLSEKILTEEEKEYLGNVIKPFRDRIRCAIKSKNLPDEHLRIHLERYDDKKDGDIIYLPRFEAGTMYKGMQINKKYTLNELGL